MLIGILHIVILIVYIFSLLSILLFSLFQLQLAILYLKSRRKNRLYHSELKQPDNYPVVTIQLPVYNERYVADRLLGNIAGMDYPPDKLEIQILDDSTDETSAILKNKIKELSDSGLDIKYIHRAGREGYKAGALKEGLRSARGEFIAIFDADYLPYPDFLKKTIPCFSDEKIGAVQTRWGHLNRNYSLLTQIQAFAIDVHFTIEQSGRNSKGYFINFNGTAGVWRKTAILDAGNWEDDTLIEDLDLSYRAQVKGWKFKYLEDVVTPAELPVTLSAIRVQQFRWMKGGTQNFLKNYKKVIHSSFPAMTKANGIFHMLNSTVFFFSFLTSLLSFPVIVILKAHPEYNGISVFASVFILPTIILLIYYGIAYFTINHTSWSVLLFPVYFWFFLVITLGMSLHNAIGIAEAFLGKNSSFQRTPKFNIRSRQDSWKQNKYIARGINYISVFEGIIALFFLWCIIESILMGQYGFIFFYVMLFLGFGLNSGLSFRKIAM